MFMFSKWEENDGYHESILMYFYAHSAQPLMKVRAVLTGEGTYESIVREFTGQGQKIDWIYGTNNNLEQAKRAAKILSKAQLNLDISNLSVEE